MDEEEESEEIFLKLFVTKRVEQLQAVKNILTLDMDRQRGFLDKITSKIQEVMMRHRVNMESSGYMPSDGQKFPDDTMVRESLSLILENSCLLCDIILRLPDEMHKRLTANKELGIIIKWSVGYVKELSLLDQSTHRLLNLCSQEIGLMAKDSDYHNPYRIVKTAQKKFDDPPQPTKKPRLKIKRGPKMSKTEL